MITHLVAFRTRHPVGSAAEAAFLKAGRELAGLPMVHAFKCFRQIGRKCQFTWVFSMEFAGQAEYDAYNAHPVHVQFVETRWKPEVESFLEIDQVEAPEP